MPRRDAVSQLPDEVRKKLDARLVKTGFSDYRGLETWLRGQGFEISRSAMQRYGAKFEDRLGMLKLASEQAKAIVEQSPDDEGAVSEALMRLVQEKLFSVLMDFEITDPSKLNLASLAKSIAELGRASVTQKKWQAQVREKTDAAAAAVEKITRKGGMSEAMRDEIRNQILGISG